MTLQMFLNIFLQIENKEKKTLKQQSNLVEKIFFSEAQVFFVALEVY